MPPVERELCLPRGLSPESPPPRLRLSTVSILKPC